MSALTDYFKGETFSYYEMAKEIAKIHLLSRKPGSSKATKSRSSAATTTLVHHLHGNHHLRSSDRADPPGFHPCGHHPYHQPLGKPPAVPGRQLLGRDRGGPDQADRSRILAHGLPRDLRARRQVAHQVPARHREELPHQVSARIQRQRHQISRNPQRPGRPAQLHLGNDRLLEGRDAHGEQPHEQRDVRRNDNQHPDRTAVLPERRPHAVVPAAGPRLRLRVRLPRAAGRRGHITCWARFRRRKSCWKRWPS